jgi:lysophospholipase L1-like esterase
MYDFVHTNELGARVIATALYEQLRPELLRLSGGQRP